MTLWAIVPVKPLSLGKSRLACVLSQKERVNLNSRFLKHTLETLKGIPDIEQVMVVSRDQKALAMARDFGARTFQEDGTPHLNIALTRATVLVSQHATRGVLILPADLPLLTTDDVYALIEKAGKPPSVVIAPDRHRKGTNALLVCPPGLIEYDFGPGSFKRHCERALQASARLEIVEFHSLSLDVDLPEDLAIVSMTSDSEAESRSKDDCV
jgi:2-phospho-L-lactate guanylyltransferase